MKPTVLMLPPFNDVDEFKVYFEKSALNVAREAFARNGQVIPAFSISFPNRSTIMMLPWENVQEKRYAVEVIKAGFKLERPIAVGFCCEIGFKSFEKGQEDDMNLAKEIGVNILPDKQDGLLLHFEVAGQEPTMIVYEVLTKEGKKELGPIAKWADKVKGMQGPMAKFIPS